MLSKEEFEEYLISIGGLVNGWYPDREPIIDAFFCDINKGWYGLVKNLIEELIAAGWDKHIHQIKEKFGGLRFYISEGNNEIYKIIEKYELLSYKTCELCSNEGKLRKGGWLVTLCDKCLEENGKRN